MGDFSKQIDQSLDDSAIMDKIRKNGHLDLGG